MKSPFAPIRKIRGHLSAFLLFLLCSTAFADGVTASLKNSSTVIRADATTGSRLGSISVDNAISVGCDGTTIAVLCANGNVRRYDARSGSYQGAISTGQKATGVQVSGGVIVVQCGQSLRRYDAKSGGYLGSSSL